MTSKALLNKMKARRCQRLDKSHHGQAQVKQGRPSKGVGQAVYELRQDSRDPLAQEKVGDYSYYNHEHYRVLQHLDRQQQ